MLLLRALGHDVDRASLSNHSWVFGEEKANIAPLKGTDLSNFYLNIGEKFVEHIEKELNCYDFFITGHTPCLSLLFSSTKKPVIVLVSTRYEHPFTGNSESWKKFNDYLQEKYSAGQFHFVSNNYYDAEYFFHYTGIQPTVIQSLCHYTKDMWNPKIGKWVLDSRVNICDPRLVVLKGTKYSSESFYQHEGVLCIPYQVSTMSMFEHSAAGMPVRYPSIDEILELRRRFPNNVLPELSWRTVSQNYSNAEYKKIKTFGSLPSPNDLAEESLREWLKFSDCYTPWMGNVIGNDGLSFESKRNIFFREWEEILQKISQ